MNKLYSVSIKSPISKIVSAITNSIIRDWGHGRSAVLVRQTKLAKARRRPIDKIVIEEERDASGRLHCATGPAVKLYVPGTHWPILEAHFIAGRAHNSFGPCVVQREPSRYFVLREMFGENDALHNRWQPAIVEMPSLTSNVRTREVWVQRGKLHRVCGPADVRRDIDSKRTTHAEWHLFGEALATMDLRVRPVDDVRLLVLHRTLEDIGAFPTSFDFRELQKWRHGRRASADPAPTGGPV